MKTAIWMVLVGLVVWWWLGRRRQRQRASPSEDAPAWSAASPALAADVELRLQGERGMGGPAYGDVLCADGVYLPHVWERDFQTSADGRWLLVDDYGEAPCLVDRQQRLCWSLLPAELPALHAAWAQLPVWTRAAPEAQAPGEAMAQTGAQLGAEGARVLAALHHAPQPLVALLDLWLMPGDVPQHDHLQAPVLTPPAHAAVQLSLQRVRPVSLRHARAPLQTWQRADWQFVLDGQAAPWGLDEDVPQLCWRADGRAFACYGYPMHQGQRQAGLALLMWSVECGWQQWEATQPEDRKPWSIGLALPESVTAPDPLALQWEGLVLLQRMVVDTPELERLHDGRSIHCVMSEVEGCTGHSPDGRPLLAPLAQVHFWWRREAAHPERWCAQSEPMGGQPLRWVLVHAAPDEWGGTAAYALHWGDTPLPGLWELEHVVVQGRWALLRPWEQAPQQGGPGRLSVWDGLHMQALHLPWPVLRLRPQAVASGQARAAVDCVALLGMARDDDAHFSTGVWRWDWHTQDGQDGQRRQPLDTEGLHPVYAWHTLAVDAQGQWQVAPRWRRVAQVQHPCADGDYVWDLANGRDGLWWWGGLNLGINNYWSLEEVRTEGVCITRSGAVLCGVGPHAWPHPQGDGWLVLEHVEQDYSEPHHWHLHWLRPAQREVLTLPLRAYVPVVQHWDAQGLAWQDEQDPQWCTQEATWPQAGAVAAQAWQQAARTPLHETAPGVWLRAQDQAYAAMLRALPQSPWR